MIFKPAIEPPKACFFTEEVKAMLAIMGLNKQMELNKQVELLTIEPGKNMSS